MLHGLEALAIERQNLQLTVDVHAELLHRINTENDPINSMELLPNQRRRAMRDPIVGLVNNEGEKEGSEVESDVPYAVFSSDEEEDI